jgi:pantoate--beta-alanine ligase
LVELLFFGRNAPFSLFQESLPLLIFLRMLFDKTQRIFKMAHPMVKLFRLRLTLPDFVEKDFQQAAIIRRMVRDLNFPIQIIVAPTVREADGLAMSSRNVYLNPDERLRALGLSRALQAVSERVAAGGAATAEVKALMEKVLVEHGLRMDYAEIVDAETLKAVEQTMPGNVGLIAAFCGKTRLIDNRIL